MYIYIYIYAGIYTYIYIYPVRCAQSRHRAFLLASFFENACILVSLLQWNFLDFGRQKSSFSDILGARGHFLEARGPISTIFGFVVILGEFRDERVVPFWNKNLTTHPLLGVLDFWCFSEGFFFQFFWILGGRRFHFRPHFDIFWEAPGSPKCL